MEFIEKKYWFTYHFYALNPKSGNLYPCGGSFDKNGAREILQVMLNSGKKPAKMVCKMIAGLPSFDWANVLNEREIRIIS